MRYCSPRLTGYINTTKATIANRNDSVLIEIPQSRAFGKEWIEECIEELKHIYSVNRVIIQIEGNPIEDPKEYDYELVTSCSQLTKLTQHLKEKQLCSLDFETDSLNTFTTNIIGIGISTGVSNFYIPIETVETDCLPLEYVMAELAEVFNATSFKLIVHNAKFELKILKRYGIEPGSFYDTMLAIHLEDPSNSKSLKESVKRVFNIKMKNFKEVLEETDVALNSIHHFLKRMLYLFNKREWGENYIVSEGHTKRRLEKDEWMPVQVRHTPLELMAEYCCADVYFTYKLYEHFKFSGKQESLLAADHELLKSVIEMEQNGVELDCEHFTKLTGFIQNRISRLEKLIQHVAGREFNINSNQQLGAIIFEELSLAEPVRTNNGNYKVDEKTLKRIRATTKNSDARFLNYLLDYKEKKKLLTTYCKLPEMIEPTTKRLHCNFNSTGTATGRFSSSDPNLQNLPASGLGKEVRRGIIASAGKRIITADYSQIELRLFAHFAQDKTMLQAFIDGKDAHAAKAAEMFDVDIESVTKNQRGVGKTLNFSITYGAGAKKIAETAGCTVEEAEIFIDQYYESIPRLKPLMQETIDQARRDGYVETLMGRRRYFPKINSSDWYEKLTSERQCFNALIQGTAADIMRIAIVKVAKAIEGTPLKMLLTVHDELVLECPEELVEEWIPTIKREMIPTEADGFPRLDVPLEVEIESGVNYGESK